MPQEPQVIADFYDLTLYLVGRIAKFPRHHRHSLGTDMEHGLQAVLALLVRARYAGRPDEKAEFLARVNVELEVLRFQLRLAKDLAVLPLTGHGHAVKLVSQVGIQVGGWLKAARAPRGAAR